MAMKAMRANRKATEAHHVVANAMKALQNARKEMLAMAGSRDERWQALKAATTHAMTAAGTEATTTGASSSSMTICDGGVQKQLVSEAASTGSFKAASIPPVAVVPVPNTVRTGITRRKWNRWALCPCLWCACYKFVRNNNNKCTGFLYTHSDVVVTTATRIDPGTHSDTHADTELESHADVLDSRSVRSDLTMTDLQFSPRPIAPDAD